MKFAPVQNFFQHVPTQKYQFSMLDWFGGVVSLNIHKFPLISNICTFKLHFKFLNVFSNFEFHFNHKHLLWMRKVLQLYYKIMYY